MGKIKAQKLAREERLSWGDLLALVNADTHSDAAPCPVNPELSYGYCRDLYRKIIAERTADEKPAAWKTDVYSKHAGAVKPWMDFLIVVNILRIFHP